MRILILNQVQKLYPEILKQTIFENSSRQLPFQDFQSEVSSFSQTTLVMLIFRNY